MMMSSLIDLEKCKVTISAPFDWKDPEDPVRKFTEETTGEIVRCWYLVDGSMVCLYKVKDE